MHPGVFVGEVAVVDRQLEVVPAVGVFLGLAAFQRLGPHEMEVRVLPGVRFQLGRVGLAGLLDLVEAFVVVHAVGVGRRMVVESVETTADFHPKASHLREAAFDFDGLPSRGHQRSLQMGEGPEAFTGGLPLEDQAGLRVGAEARGEMGVEAFGEFLGDPGRVGDLPHGRILAELFQRGV